MTKKTYSSNAEIYSTPDGKTIFEKFQYSSAVVANGLVFVAGQIGLDPDGSIPSKPERQFQNAFERLKLILEETGSTMDDLVELVSYHVGSDMFLEVFTKVKERYVPSPFPTWTILGVSALARPGLIIEIKAVAIAN